MQKPADLEGECPFMNAEGPCPYGLACRFFGTHKDGVPTETSDARKKCAEINGLKKDVQKLLWKNKMSFPKADAKLKALGLLVLLSIYLYINLLCFFRSKNLLISVGVTKYTISICYVYLQSCNLRHRVILFHSPVM